MAARLRIAARALRHHLKAGGVIAYPTESCFGLGCDPMSRLGVHRILRLKRRPSHKGLILIADRRSRFQPYIQPLAPSQQQQLDASWPGPNTWLLPASKRCPHWLSGRHDSVAARVTAHRLSARISAAAGMAIVSTSANRSGHRAATSTRQCQRLFGSQVRVLAGLTGGARRPSTIRDLASGKVLRA